MAHWAHALGALPLWRDREAVRLISRAGFCLSTTPLSLQPSRLSLCDRRPTNGSVSLSTDLSREATAGSVSQVGRGARISKIDALLAPLSSGHRPPPTLVTLSRSSRDGFVPRSLVASGERFLLRSLEKSLGPTLVEYDAGLLRDASAVSYM